MSEQPTVEYWRVDYDFAGPVSGNGSISIITTTPAGIDVKPPSLAGQRTTIQGRLAEKTGHRAAAFTVIIKSVSKMVDEKEYIGECE